MTDPVRSHEHSVGDDSVRARTGRGREEWFALLDAAGAAGWKHPEIARWLAEQHGVDPWWCQSLTVGYEQARGLRVPGQRPDGTFETNISVTLPVDVGTAYAWCAEEDRRSGWLEAAPEVRGTRAARSVRWGWDDGSRTTVHLTALPETATGPRTRLAVQHGGLTTPDRLPELKDAWTTRLRRLRGLLG